MIMMMIMIFLWENAVIFGCSFDFYISLLIFPMFLLRKKKKKRKVRLMQSYLFSYEILIVYDISYDIS